MKHLNKNKGKAAMKSQTILLLTVLLIANLLITGRPAYADGGMAEDKTLTGQVSDPLVEAQEKLMHAKGSYNTARQQESAIENMRKATKLSLKAAKLRTRAEKLQTKADLLVNKANQTALSRGLYITNPLSPVMMQPPPEAPKQAQVPSFVPVPGQGINIVIPKQEEVSYEQGDSNLPEPPTVSNF